MSAYIVSEDTINYLVTAATRYGITFYCPVDPTNKTAAVLASTPMTWDSSMVNVHARSNADLIANVLWAQNHISVNARYRTKDVAEPFTHVPVAYELIDPVAVLKSVACVRYQSCESDDYSSTFAAAILDFIEKETMRHLTGYDDAPWGWTRQDAVKTITR